MCAFASSRPTSRSAWQEALAGAYTNVDALARDGLLPAETLGKHAERLRRHALRIPKALAARFDRTNLSRCPLFRQAVPWVGEVDPERLPPYATAQSEALYGRPLPWQADAIGDVTRLAAARLTHRYKHRALLHVTSACALVCRYCFRKTSLEARVESLYAGPFAEALEYLRRHEEIEEVVLTGGDPMVLPNEAWRRLLEQLDSIPHLRLVRVHTRMPAVLPERFESALADIFARARVRIAVACHVNHPLEWSDEARDGLNRFRQAGVTLLHQGVLLRGINDNADTLFRLLQTAYDMGVVPFSMHHPDLSPHTFGYRIGIEDGRAIMGALQGRLSGPALPRYVLDIPFGHGKIDLMNYQVTTRGPAVIEDNIGAQVWDLPLPHTRVTSDHAVCNAMGYLDVWPVNQA